MRRTFSKFIVLSLLIFAVLEKSGVSVMSLILADRAHAFEMVLSDPETNAKEAENTKEVSAKEVWLSDGEESMLSPICKSLFRQPAISRDFQIVPFYPSIPTPPPNLS
ncbi:hypothetical protein [Arcticibacter sp.]|jgi:hypothetical protein|uniref:hypothetical protein n=1 Tax=Arcticibacter sp. TaxID=1872630 RepID=UPI00388F7A43